jgi:hypothetical protein
MLAVPLLAGQSRTAEIEAARSEKEAHERPESVSGLENALLQVKQRKLLERLTAGYNGLNVRFGSMATGSGFAFGPGFLREDLAGGRLPLDASALVSTRLWQKYEAAVTAPELASGHLLLRAEAVRRDYRSLEFYGVGPESLRDNRTHYRLKDSSLGGVAAIQPVKRLRFGGTLGGLRTALGGGKRDEFPNTESIFSETSAPGLTRQTNFLRTSVFGQVDYRDDPAGRSPAATTSPSTPGSATNRSAPSSIAGISTCSSTSFSSTRRDAWRCGRA